MNTLKNLHRDLTTANKLAIGAAFVLGAAYNTLVLFMVF